MLQKECAICHQENVGFFNEKLILKGHARICKNCARKIFSQPKSFSALKWAGSHTLAQVQRVLASGQKIDLDAVQASEKDSLRRQKSMYESLRQQYVYEHASRLGQCYFNPQRKAILFPPIYGHTYKVIDDDFILGYTPVEKGEGAQERAIHNGFSTSGHQYKRLDRLGIIITLRNGANYPIDFIEGATKEGYTTKKAYEEFITAQRVLATIVRRNSQITGPVNGINVSSI